jgi:hypothetical protein
MLDRLIRTIVSKSMCEKRCVMRVFLLLICVSTHEVKVDFSFSYL